MFAELREQFGWETFTRLFAEYWTLNAQETPKTDIDKRDRFMVRFSRLCGKKPRPPSSKRRGVPTIDAAEIINRQSSDVDAAGRLADQVRLSTAE